MSIRIDNCDCIYGMEKILDSSIDLVISSPPYKQKDGYSDFLMHGVFNQLFHICKKNSLCFINFGHLKEDKTRPFRIVEIASEYGFKLADTIIWYKNHYTPLRGNNLNNLYEFIFMFYKGSMPKLDRLAIGIEYKDRSNAKRYNNGINLRCRGNIWHINLPTTNKNKQKLHPDEFPLELPLLCIKLSGLKSGVVLDPFAGSGTVGCAAKIANLDFIGFEISSSIYQAAVSRINNI